MHFNSISLLAFFLARKGLVFGWAVAAAFPAGASFTCLPSRDAAMTPTGCLILFRALIFDARTSSYHLSFYFFPLFLSMPKFVKSAYSVIPSNIPTMHWPPRTLPEQLSRALPHQAIANTWFNHPKHLLGVHSQCSGRSKNWHVILLNWTRSIHLRQVHKFGITAFDLLWLMRLESPRVLEYTTSNSKLRTAKATQIVSYCLANYCDFNSSWSLETGKLVQMNSRYKIQNSLHLISQFPRNISFNQPLFIYSFGDKLANMHLDCMLATVSASIIDLKWIKTWTNPKSFASIMEADFAL